MRIFLFVFFLPMLLFSQKNKIESKVAISTIDNNSQYNRKQDSLGSKSKKKIATLDMYRFISLERDTTYIDTSLTIQKEYSHNYLRRDTFGLLAFPNEGQTYNTLHYNLTNLSALPEFGFTAKHFNFIEANQIRYCSVATPVTELYFKSVMKQGQSVDSFLSLNITPRLNFTIAYKGLRSEGRYINQLSSTGNFRFTTSYNTKNERYFANAHFASQDILNEENGGITTINDFESEDTSFDTRERLEVYLTDAKSFLKGKRFFIDHQFRINANPKSNNWFVTHQFNYEYKFFEYNQATVASKVGLLSFNRFGDSYLTRGINDQTRFNKLHNIFGVLFQNNHLGKFKFFVDDFRTNYYYSKILIRTNAIIPASLSQDISNFGGQYDYQNQKWQSRVYYIRSLGNESLSNLDAKLIYTLDDNNQFSIGYQNINKLPNNNFELYQSSYVNYNWSNSFKNEKINLVSANLSSPILNASLQFSTLNDHLYFIDKSTNASVLLVAPEQYNKTINYISLKLSKEFKFGKFGLDNTILFQKVDQQEAILNVPNLVTRNSLYYSDYMFKKAMYLQTGFVFNYFSNYYANDYNPVIGEFFVQNRKEIGNYPNIDFFVNARIQRTRIYFKAEHFNSSITGNNFYAAPNNPYRDFMIRFGLVWNFFE